MLEGCIPSNLDRFSHLTPHLDNLMSLQPSYSRIINDKPPKCRASPMLILKTHERLTNSLETLSRNTLGLSVHGFGLGLEIL